MKASILLQLYAPYLTPSEADEIRAEVAALNPRVHLVVADWPWLEVRGIGEKDAAELVSGIAARGVRFRALAGKTKTPKAKVQVSEVLTVD